MTAQTSSRTTASQIGRPPSRTEHQAPESPSDYEEEIRLRAYELWAQRGMRDGFDEEDWLDAEKEIIERYGQNAA
jgi:hypothetical protein